MVTTICFLDNIQAAFKEANRVLKTGGYLIVGFIDKESPIGKYYQQYINESPFYKVATFYSVEEIIFHLKEASFKKPNITQTIFHNLTEIKDVEPIKEGYGERFFCGD